MADEQDGPGHRFLITEPVPAELELYPESLVVRYRTPALQLRLAGVAALYTAPSLLAVVVTGVEELTTLIVEAAPDGKLRVDMATLSGHQILQALAPPPADTLTASPNPASNTVQVASRETPQNPRPGPREGQANVERKQQERIEYQGRLGFRPQLSTNTDGVDYITLSVAVKEPNAPRNAKPDWRDTSFYRERAHQVAAMNLQKGEMVKVVAYKDVREVPGRGGKIRHEMVYNGTVIRRA